MRVRFSLLVAGLVLWVGACGGDDESQVDAAVGDSDIPPPIADAAADAMMSLDAPVPSTPDATVDADAPSLPCDVVITLDGTKPSMCDQGWTESGVGLSFVNTTAEDCTDGRCSFDSTPPDQIALYPGRLNVDLSGLDCTISAVEFDVHDYCGTGCTRAFLYGEGMEMIGARNPASGMHTLRLTGVAEPTRAAASSCEGSVLEIRVQ